MYLQDNTHFLSNVKKSFLRFPLTIACSIFAAIASIVVLENNDLNFIDESSKNVLFSFIPTLMMGVPLFFCIKIFFEINSKTLFTKSIFYLLGFSFLGYIFFSFLDYHLSKNSSEILFEYFTLNIVAHLFVAFVPFLSKKGQNGFWNYNKLLFLRFLTALLYSAFILAGISVTLLLMQELLGIKIHENIYLNVFVLISLIFNTWFFIAGIPKNINQLESLEEYPIGLKVISQYVLVPFNIVYIVILYLYCLMNFGDIKESYQAFNFLSIGLSFLTILSFLLLYPFGKLAENQWIQKVKQLLYLALIPLILLQLFFNVVIGFKNNGIDFLQYYSILLGLWVLYVLLYKFFFSDNIKHIPISLSLVLILSLYGPLSAFSISKSEKDNKEKLDDSLPVEELESNYRSYGYTSGNNSSNKGIKVKDYDYLFEIYNLDDEYKRALEFSNEELILEKTKFSNDIVLKYDNLTHTFKIDSLKKVLYKKYGDSYTNTIPENELTFVKKYDEIEFKFVINILDVIEEKGKKEEISINNAWLFVKI